MTRHTIRFNFGRPISMRAFAVLVAGCAGLGTIACVPPNPGPPVIDDNFLNQNGGPPPSNDNAPPGGENDNSVGGTNNQNDNDVGAGANENADNTSTGGSGCTTEPDCALGFNCVSGACLVSTTPDVELGDENPFVAIEEGGELIIRRGFQGGNHIFMSVRVTGFPPNATVAFRRGVTPTGSTLPLVIESTVTQFLVDEGNGVNRLNQVFVFIDGVLPQDYDGREATVTIGVSDPTNPALTASVTQRVILVAEP